MQPVVRVRQSPANRRQPGAHIGADADQTDVAGNIQNQFPMDVHTVTKVSYNDSFNMYR